MDAHLQEPSSSGSSVNPAVMNGDQLAHLMELFREAAASRCVKLLRLECCSDFTEENEHKDYYENDTENPGRAVSPGAAIAPSRKSPYEHEDK